MDRRAPRSRASAQVPRRCPDWNATSFSFAGHDPLAPDERRDMTRFHYAPAPGGERSTPRLPTGILRDRGVVASTPRLPTGIVRDQSGVGPATASPVASQMTMLRDPFRRLVSAFYHSKRRKVECPTLARGASVLDFARCRNETGPRGCATKMLVGRACEALGPASKRGSASTPAAVRRGSSVGLGVSTPRRSSSARGSAPTDEHAQAAPYPSAAEVEQAKARLAEFSFVGLSDDWTASVCRAHSLFGRPTYVRGADPSLDESRRRRDVDISLTNRGGRRGRDADPSFDAFDESRRRRCRDISL